MKRIVLGHEVSFRQRTYGGAKFIWASVEIDGESHDLGDPWQDARPTKDELTRAIQYLLDLLGEEKPGHRNGQHLGQFI